MPHLLFDCRAEAQRPLLSRVLLAAVYASGLIIWACFFGWSRVPLDFADFADINVPRLNFLSQSIAAREWPLHMANTASLHGITDRFVSLPDVITTPQTIVLPVLGVQTFVLFDVLLNYSIGFAGLLALRRRFNWSLVTFVTVFLLFGFNGHILGHYGVGHFTWGAYFIFPWFALWCFELLDRGGSWPWLARMSFALGYIVLAGGQHHFTWALLLLICLMPGDMARARWCAAAVVAALLISAVRLVPPALHLQDFASAGWSGDIIGYPSFTHLLNSLVALRREAPALDPRLPGNLVFLEMNYFEVNYYVGAIGAAIILYFGVYRWARSADRFYPLLLVAVAVVMTLSMGTVFRLVRATGVPLFGSERIVARMMSLPMSMIIIVAGVFLQDTLDSIRASVWHRAIAIALLALLATDISAGVRLLRVAQSSQMMPHKVVDPGAAAHRSDPIYTGALAASGIVSMATAAGLAVMWFRRRADTR